MSCSTTASISTSFARGSPTGYLHRELGLPAHARLITTIGQLGLRKGTEVVLAAAAMVAGRAVRTCTG